MCVEICISYACRDYVSCVRMHVVYPVHACIHKVAVNDNRTSLASNPPATKTRFRFVAPPGKTSKKTDKTKKPTEGKKDKKKEKPSDNGRLKSEPISYEGFSWFHGLDSLPR